MDSDISGSVLFFTSWTTASVSPSAKGTESTGCCRGLPGGLLEVPVWHILSATVTNTSTGGWAAEMVKPPSCVPMVPLTYVYVIRWLWTRPNVTPCLSFPICTVRPCSPGRHWPFQAQPSHVCAFTAPGMAQSHAVRTRAHRHVCTLPGWHRCGHTRTHTAHPQSTRRIHPRSLGPHPPHSRPQPLTLTPPSLLSANCWRRRAAGVGAGKEKARDSAGEEGCGVGGGARAREMTACGPPRVPAHEY